MTSDLDRRPSTDRLLRAACWAVLLIWTGACLHGLLDLFLWGHDGFNGAAFLQAARNSLRFGVAGQALYHTGIEPPASADIYTRHPPLLHLHLIAAFAALGVSEWAGRLVPALYSIATGILLMRVARRWQGEAAALAAVVLYALVPLHLIYANMIDHEQGGIFWSLAACHLYLRWLEAPRRGLAVATLASVIASVQFDWPGYTIAFTLFVHALWSALRVERVRERRRVLARFAAALAATVGLCLLAFLGWAIATSGGLDDLLGGFARRTALPARYAHRLAARALDLYGILPLGLLGLWGIDVARRAWRGRLLRADLVPGAFAAAQLVHSVVFPNAGYHHAYWTFYAGPAIALGGGRIAVSLLDRLRSGVTRLAAANAEGARVAGAVAAGLVLLLAVAMQARFAADQMRWGYATGRASYEADYDDQYLDHLWARALAERYGRKAVYLVHPSAERRIHFHFYLDARHRPWLDLETDLPPRRRGALRPVLLVDLEGLGDAERDALARLARRHPTRVWQQRFVAIESWREQRWLEGYTAVETEPPWWWPWLVSELHPPTHWRRDPGRRKASVALSPGA